MSRVKLRDAKRTSRTPPKTTREPNRPTLETNTSEECGGGAAVAEVAGAGTAGTLLAKNLISRAPYRSPRVAIGPSRSVSASARAL